MKKLRQIFYTSLIGAGCISQSGFADCCFGEVSPQFAITGGYAFGQFIDIDQNYGNVGWLFYYPACGDSTILFQDTQFFFMDRGDLCLSAGLGIRQACDAVMGYLGANVYYDYRDFSYHRHPLNRVGVGIEYLGDLFEGRVNGYFPVGSAYSRGDLLTVDFPGGFTADLRNTRMGLWGVDGEVGIWFFDFKCIEFYAAVGGYSYGTYRHRDFKNNPFAGGYGRALVSWDNIVNLEVRASGDRVFHGRVEGVLWIQLPLDFFWNGFCLPCCDPCAKLWTRPVFRHSILATIDCCCYDSWNWDSP